MILQNSSWISTVEKVGKCLSIKVFYPYFNRIYCHIYQLEQSPLLTELTEHDKDLYVGNPDRGLRQTQRYPYPPHLITGGLRQAQRYPYPPHLITGPLSTIHCTYINKRFKTCSHRFASTQKDHIHVVLQTE